MLIKASSYPTLRLELSKKHIEAYRNKFEESSGSEIDKCIEKLFSCMNDNRNKQEIRVKVAALNQIYSTAITYLEPVIEKIYNEINQNSCKEIIDSIECVDKISRITWHNLRTGIEYSRNNLSFASKYIHFLSQKNIPIYDSYVWILLTGYLNQHQYEGNKLSFTPPQNYKNDFITRYNAFAELLKEQCGEEYSPYIIDKFLWQYGKELVEGISAENGISYANAKTELQRRISYR